MSSHAHNGCLATNLSLRNDPTKTLEQRQNFLEDVRGRFMRVSGVIRRTIGYENDAFGLAENEYVQNARTPTKEAVVTDLAKQYAGVSSEFALNAADNPRAFRVALEAYEWAYNKIDAPESYDYPTDRGKIQAFIDDLKEWIEGEILEPANFTELREGDHWTSEYITNSYVIARNVAVGRLKQEGVSASAWTAEELTQTRTSLKTLRDLYSRTYENLEDITDDMADVVRRELTQGFAEGKNPKAMARSITDEVKDIQRTRAETLARTETINAATKATLDEYERGGVDGVMHGEWLHSFDEDVCAFCRRLGGESFTTSEFRANHAVEFRGQVYRLAPPSHPNGRCAITPAVGLDEESLAPLSERVPGELLTE